MTEKNNSKKMYLLQSFFFHFMELDQTFLELCYFGSILTIFGRVLGKKYAITVFVVWLLGFSICLIGFSFSLWIRIGFCVFLVLRSLFFD